MVLNFVFRALFIAFLLFGCTQVERDNPYDPDGINYKPRLVEISSSSEVPSSSSEISSSSSEEPSSSSEDPSSSSEVSSSSSEDPSSSSEDPSSSSEVSSSSSEDPSSSSEDPSSSSEVSSSSSEAPSSSSEDPSSSSEDPSSSSETPSSSSSSVTPSSSSSPNIVYGSPVTYGEEIYQTIVIGNQTWFAKNLNYNVPGSVCCGNLESSCEAYGRLYDWSTAMGFSSNCNSDYCSNQIQSPHQGICPDGWHIPSEAEWTALENAVGGSSTAGTKLKSTIGWNHDGNGTDNYGFSALPGGGHLYIGGTEYFAFGTFGYWWSASEYEYHGGYAYCRYMNVSEEVLCTNQVKRSSLSIRCLKD